MRLADRGGVHEYVCVRCGHPLVFPEGTDRFAGASRFTKKVRYACGLFGHRVTAVAARQGFVEYACHCGHSFLKHAAGERKVRHPLRCFFLAHRIRFVTHREGYAEYVCDDCGHPFCFVVQPGPRSLDRGDQSGDSRAQAPVARGVGALSAAPGVVRKACELYRRVREIRRFWFWFSKRIPPELLALL